MASLSFAAQIKDMLLGIVQRVMGYGHTKLQHIQAVEIEPNENGGSSAEVN
ncbi:hypothetical protein ACP4OV_025701 [Aristida adscensionis]